MTDRWKTLLEKQTQLTSLPDDGQQLVCPLTAWGVINVTGEDAQSFLQNLLINDIKSLSNGNSQLSGFCTPKGRLLAIFWVIQREENQFELILPQDQCAFVAQRLSMFKLRSKVDITVDEAKKVSGLIQCHLAETVAIDEQRALLIETPENSADLLDKLIENGAVLAAATAWQFDDMASGIAMIFASSREQFTAQQLNLDLINAVSFKKGCYPGQEVIARLHYLGEPKRRLFSGQCNQAELPVAGVEVFDKEGAVAGHVVQALQLNAEKVLLQLSLKLAGANLPIFTTEGQSIEQVTALVA
jgi:folate-binding protein YgfZ